MMFLIDRNHHGFEEELHHELKDIIAMVQLKEHAWQWRGYENFRINTSVKHPVMAFQGNSGTRKTAVAAVVACMYFDWA